MQIADETFGKIAKPVGVGRFDAATGGIGLLGFVSALIQLGTVVAGLWVMFNFIMAGYTYITSSGDSAAHGKVAQKITNSVAGLIIIVLAYAFAALIGLLFFGKADYILNPTLRSGNVSYEECIANNVDASICSQLQSN